LRRTGLSRSDRFHIGFLIGLILLAGVPSLFTRDTWSGDETAFLEAAREMVVLGDYSVLCLNGEPAEQRPPLPFWLAALLWKAGFGYDAARLLSILALLATVLACYFLTARSAGRQAGLVGAAATLTTLVAFWHVRQGVPGALLMLLVTAALLSGQRALHTPGGTARTWWLGCYGALGLCVLTDGVLGLVLPGSVLLIYGVANRGRARPGGASHLLGLAALAAIVLAWAIPTWVAQGTTRAFAAAALHSVKRAAESCGERNLLRHAVGTALQFLPWIVILPVAVVRAVRGRAREGGDLAFFAALWLLVLGGAILLFPDAALASPLLLAPAVGLLCGSCLAPTSGEERPALKPGQRSMTAAVILTSLMVGGLLTIGVLHLLDISYLLVGKHHVCPVTDEPYSPTMLVAALPLVALALGASLAALLTPASRQVRRALMLAGTVVLVGLPLDVFLTPYMNSFMSPRAFASEVVRCAGDSGRVYQYRSHHDGRYNLYTGRVRMPVIHTPQRLRALLMQRGTFVIADEKRLSKAMRREEWQEHVVAQRAVGHRFMLLLEGGSLLSPVPPFSPHAGSEG